MFKIKRLMSAVALASMVGAASADILTTPDSPIDFGGFDWASNGSVLIDGYGVRSGVNNLGDTDTFTLTYQSFAANIQNAAGVNQFAPGLRQGTGTGYEFTINATITEQVTCITPGCTAVTITPISGTWDVYYQAVGNADLVNGTGVLDGTLVMSGVFGLSDTIIGGQGPTNPGNVTLAGTFLGAVNFVDGVIINDTFTGTKAVSTLQFGANTTAWTRPNAFDGIGAIGPNTNTRFVGQADANQSFTNDVPEPGSLALVGLALAGVAMLGRRRKAV